MQPLLHKSRKVPAIHRHDGEKCGGALHLEEDQVNIKATTEEGLGFTGKKEGISAQAICCISKALDLMPDDQMQSGCSGCPGCAKNAEE